MNKLYLYAEGNPYGIYNKKDFLLRAAERLGLYNVIELTLPLHDTPEYVLNIEPYNDNFFKGTKWTGSWEIDCLLKRQERTRHWDQIDTVFLANQTSLYPIGGKFQLLFQACDPYLYDFSIQPETDFVLAGSISDVYYYKDWGERQELPSTDIYAERARVYGKLKDEFSYEYFGNHFKTPEYISLQQKGRVQFIRSMKVFEEGEIAQRFFELLAIGPVLTNYTKDCDHLGLVEGEDYMYYKSDEEMLTKMRLLVNDEILRKKIQENGRRKAFMYHTYEHRLMTIINHLRLNYDFKI